MSDSQIRTAGYAPTPGVLSVIEKVRGGLNGPIDLDRLSQIGVTESLTKRTLNSLRTLGLVDSDGSLSESFLVLKNAPPSEYPGVLAAFVRGVYQDVFEILDPATATPEQLKNAFWGYEPRGQIDSMIRLFIGLCEAAGLVQAASRPKPEGATARPRAPRPPIRKPTAPTGSPSMTKPQGPLTPPPPVVPAPDPLLAAYFQKLPASGSALSKADKEKWITALESIFQIVYFEKETDT
jgi:hypothetical protein